MGSTIQETGISQKPMDLENTFGQMVTNTLENGISASSKVQVTITFTMETSMKGCTSMESFMEEVNSYGRME